jgi:uncharacterized protein DUF2188
MRRSGVGGRGPYTETTGGATDATRGGDVRRTVYFVLREQDGWKVTEEGRELSQHEIKEDAIDAAVRAAQANEPSQVRVQKQDGTWDEERTYGDDPHPPPG